MTENDSTIKKKDKVYNFLVNLKTVKISIYLAIFTFIPALIIGILVAQLHPGGFNPIDNFISDLGSFKHTPAPYFLDYGAMLSAFWLVPMTFYMEKEFAPYPRNMEELKKTSRMRFRLAGAGLFWQLLGLIGFFGIGLFSEDRTTSLGLHGIFSVVVFMGLSVGGIFYGLVILIYPTIIPKLLGVFMIFVPIILTVIYLLTLIIILEWVLLLSLFAWMIPLAIIFLKKVNKELVA